MLKKNEVLRIIEAVDGDTIKVELIQEIEPVYLGIVLPEEDWRRLDLGFDTYRIDQGDRILHTTIRSCRLHNLDTPETRGVHREAGLLVEELIKLWASAPGEYNSVSAGKSYKDYKGKYEGRYIGNLQHPNGQWWSRYLVENKLCKPTSRTGKRPKWTQKELDEVSAIAKALLQKELGL